MTMIVAELIEHLKTLPQDLPVAAYDATEAYDWLSPEGITIKTETDGYILSEPGSSFLSPRYKGDFVAIIGA